MQINLLCENRLPGLLYEIDVCRPVFLLVTSGQA